jgi:chromosome segregation ATPase
MGNNKDKSERLRYLKEELRKQKEKLDFHKKHIEELENSIKFQRNEIMYNEGWIKFHKTAIKKHKKQVGEAKDNLEKGDQIRKLRFHREQIENHHNVCMKYHQNEIAYAEKWINLNKEVVSDCIKQIRFLENRMSAV